MKTLLYSRAVVTAICLTVLSVFAQTAQATPPDLTAAGVIATIDRKATYNLGATGLRGWIYTKAANNLDAAQGRTTLASRQILVTHVGAASPADGVVKVDDVILGVEGKPFIDDARKSFALAIQQAETESKGGVLKLMVSRGGQVQEITLKLAVLGSYSDSAPWDCAKSKRIFENACKVLEKEELTGGWTGAVQGLALLATGDPDYLPKLKSLARSLSQPEADPDLKPPGPIWGNTWDIGYRQLFLCEYYIITRDPDILPVIKNNALSMARGQGMYGTFWHGYAALTKDGKFNGSVPPYGPVNSAGLPANLSLVLSKKCGVEYSELDQAIARAAGFFGYYTDKGSIPYGEHEPWPYHECNGKSATAAVMFSAMGDKPKDTGFLARMATAGYANREYGHTGQGFSYLWSALGAATGGPEAAAAFFQKVSWHLDLVRRSDGSFTYDGQEQYGAGETDDGTYYGKSSYNGLSPAATYVLTYALPLRKLVITGRGADESGWLDRNEAAVAVASGHFDLDRHAMSPKELVAAFGNWSPIVRSWAAEELAKRPESKTMIAGLIELAEGGEPHQIQGACETLGLLNTPEALPVLVKQLAHPDRWVRYKAAEAIKRMGKTAKPALEDILKALDSTAEPLTPICWEDPIQFAHGKLASAVFNGPLKDDVNQVAPKLRYPAIDAVSNNPDGMARATLENFFENQLSQEDVIALAPVILAAIENPCPADTMFSNGIRMAGLKALTKYHFKEGIAAAVDLAKTQGGHGSESRTGVIMEIITRYGAAAKSQIPAMKEIIVMFDQEVADKMFPPDLNQVRVGAVNEAIRSIETATTQPELRSIELAGMVPAENDLAKDFANPPASARPWVFWFWQCGNITKEGLTADLEAMNRAGVGGVLIMEVQYINPPPGPVGFISDEWRDLFKHMVSEADRLGIEVNMNNGAGWCGSGGPWVPLDKAMQRITTSEKQIVGGKKFEGELPKPPAKEDYYRDIAVLAFPTPVDASNPAYRIRQLDVKLMMNHVPLEAAPDSNIPPESVISKSGMIDLTSKMDANGKLSWDPPALPGSPSGEWTVMRFGHTFTGMKTRPIHPSGKGPECDKLSKEGIEVHYANMIGKLAKDAKPFVGKVFTSTHIDSWESGGQDWTPKMREEFEKRRGYNIIPFLPVLAGRILDNPETSERFLRDVRQTVSELVAENYVGHLRTLAAKDGLRLSMEAYSAPANDLDMAEYIDDPICEFWWPKSTDLYWSVKSMSSVAHVNGRQIVGAEAFTADDSERWRAHPALLKALGDRAFCGGVNRFIIHRYAMQPWVQDRRPGMSMGPWGLHYERTQTWWEDSKAWHQYLARCQHLLRQGNFVADVLSLQSEEPMQRFKTMELTGYDYDGIGPQAFLKNVTVKGGILEVPSGMKYRLLVLPGDEAMTPRMLAKIKELVESGATVVGKPPAKAPGLSGYPQSDARIKELVEELWGADSATDRKVGKGRVLTGKTPTEVLADMGVKPDFTASRPIHYTHRATDDMDIYFVASSEEQSADVVCTFRVSGRKPEVWFPDTGRMEPVSVFEEVDGCTRIPLRFEPAGSMFVLFRKGSVKAAEHILSVKHDGQELIGFAKTQLARVDAAGDPAFDLVSHEISRNGNYEIKTADGKVRQVEVTGLPGPIEINGPWELGFAPGWGAPDRVVLENLSSWSEHSDAGVKYFSGAGTYRKRFTLPIEDGPPKVEGGTSGKSKRGNLKSLIHLDLGKVAVMAEVKLNGKDLGVLWKPPYRVDITDAVKTGENALEIKVVNLWINRMIGDELLPEDSERDDTGMLLKWPQWLEEGKPNPTGRFTFTSWRLWKQNEPLQESGLLGPVQVLTTKTIDPN
jgi:hypothetical protein